jgi:hypothetical protein
MADRDAPVLHKFNGKEKKKTMGPIDKLQGVTVEESEGIFMKVLQPFDDRHIARAPDKPGVYIVYETGTPVYVGRSRVSIRERLVAHRGGRGNWFLKLIGPTACFEYSETLSPEQAEAQLIQQLKTKTYGNYRFETDPELFHLKCALLKK